MCINLLLNDSVKADHIDVLHRVRKQRMQGFGSDIGKFC